MKPLAALAPETLRTKRKHYEAKAAVTPKPTGELQPAPDWMDDVEREAYQWIQENTAPKVLANCDWLIVQMCAVLYGRFKNRSADSKDLAMLRTCLNDLGLTPLGRTKIQITASKENVIQAENEFKAV